MDCFCPHDLPFFFAQAESLRLMRLPEVFEWPDEEVHGAGRVENESLKTIQEHYTKISELMVAKQGDELDKFYDHFLARIGRSMIEEPPMAFSHGKKEFLVSFYRCVLHLGLLLEF